MRMQVATEHHNPTPGVILNQLGGPNVRAGMKADYTGKDLSWVNFQKLLMGTALDASLFIPRPCIYSLLRVPP